MVKSPLDWIYNNFKRNTAKMLVVTGTIGWGLSSLAQIGAVLFNPKIPREQKAFLVPQEVLDAVVNIGSFFLITQMTKKSSLKWLLPGKSLLKKSEIILIKIKICMVIKSGNFRWI